MREELQEYLIKIKALTQDKCVCLNSCIIYLPNPSDGQDMTQGQFLSGV